VIKNLRHIFFFLSFSLLSTLVLATSPTGKKVKKDTVSAVVLYGNGLLFNSIEDLTDERINEVYDSLKSLHAQPRHVMNQIDLYLRVKDMSLDEVAFLLDSLFEADDVQYALINQINLYIKENPPLERKITEEITIRRRSPYPAGEVYHNWNTSKPHPYPYSLFTNDENSEIKITGGELGQYASPLEKIVVTSRFGWRDGRSHRGYDLDLEVWDKVHSMFDGKVRFAGYYGGYGRVIVVRHYNGLETLYAHLHRYRVKVGDEVKAGDLIGLGGSSGHSTGSHLHFEVRYKGIALDPGTFIDRKKKKLVSNSIYLKKQKYGYASIPIGIPFHEVQRVILSMKLPRSMEQAFLVFVKSITFVETLT